jgi:hypothetical protein
MALLPTNQASIPDKEAPTLPFSVRPFIVV